MFTQRQCTDTRTADSLAIRTGVHLDECRIRSGISQRRFDSPHWCSDYAVAIAEPYRLTRESLEALSWSCVCVATCELGFQYCVSRSWPSWGRRAYATLHRRSPQSFRLLEVEYQHIQPWLFSSIQPTLLHPHDSSMASLMSTKYHQCILSLTPKHQ
jgi:hypothetical protein